MCHQLTKGVDPKVIQADGLDAYFTDHGFGVYPCAASGVPFNAACLAVKDDPVADLVEDMAADVATLIVQQNYNKTSQY